MKKLLIIVLIVCFVAIFGVMASAKFSFAGWDRWDEELPPENSKDWHWVWPSKKPAEYIIRNSGVLGDNLIISSLDLYYGEKFNMKAVSVCLYVSRDINKNDLDWYITNGTIALASFFSKKNKIIVMAYRKEGDILRFFEKWEIEYQVFKTIEAENVIPLESQVREEFKKWIESISCLDPKDINKNLLNFILPKILVSEESFIVSVADVYIKK